MKVLIFLTLALVVCYASAIEYTLETCECGEHYEAQKSNDGKVQCVGKLLDALKPCSIPEAPRCICKKDTVTGIMTDSEGTWCINKKAQQAQKKWACENTDEWEAYKVAVEKYKKTLEE